MTQVKPIIVMKYGGVSLGEASSLRRIVTAIAKKAEEASPVLVFSAAGKTTRELLQCARETARGHTSCFEELLSSVFAQHRGLAAALIPERRNAAGLALLDRYYQDLSRIMHGLSETGELTPRLQDQILSYGELMSTSLMAEILTARGIRNRLLHAPELIITNDAFSGADPVPEISYPLIRNAVTSAHADGAIPIIQGFIGSTRDGVPTTLGFEGSDYTAALVAEACSASALEVWKNVQGVMSADPRICPTAEIIPSLSYERAEVLCSCGARILHPKTLSPVRNSSIPVYVKPLDSPESAGTVIQTEAKAGENRFAAVAYRAKAFLLRLEIREGIAAEHAVQEVSMWLEQALLRPLYLATDGKSVLAAVNTETTMLPQCYALDAVGTLQTSEPIAAVSIIGDGLYHAGVLARIFRELRDTYICFSSQGVNPDAVTIGIRRSDLEQTVLALHDCFVLNNRGSL